MFQFGLRQKITSLLPVYYAVCRNAVFAAVFADIELFVRLCYKRKIFKFSAYSAGNSELGCNYAFSGQIISRNGGISHRTEQFACNTLCIVLVRIGKYGNKLLSAKSEQVSVRFFKYVYNALRNEPQHLVTLHMRIVFIV